MNNGFDREELARWFCFNTECWWCGANHWDCFHHIDGRSKKFSNSILNAAPVSNSTCHLPIHGKLKLKENKILLLRKTLEFLKGQGYEFNDIDIGFIETRSELFEEILNNEKEKDV